MRGSQLDIEHVLGRLSGIMQTHAPDVWEALRPGASEAELDLLREAVRPYELTGELAALFRWANGQEGGPWWPGMECGRLLTTADAAAHYHWLIKHAEPWQWSPLWVPIAYDGWNQAGVEITSDRPGVVIDGSFPDSAQVIAPTLATLLDVTADMVQAGTGSPSAYPDARVWRKERAALVDARPEWSNWPYDRTLATDIGSWPGYWQSASHDRSRGH
jgi:hypothetical protein